MQPKRNNYIGQYKKKDTIDGSFDQYWSKYCSDVKDDSIRSVLESVFNVLNDDIKLTRKASDKNQSIFDFYEYIDLMKVLKQSLDLYLGIDDNELEGRVDTARKRIKNQFVQQFNEVHEKLKKEYQESLGVSEEQTDDSESKEKLSERIKESIQNFFDKKKQEKEQESKDKEGESEEKKNQPGQVESSEKEKQDKEDKNKSKQQISDFEKRLSVERADDSVKNVDKTKNADLSSLGRRIMGIIRKVVGIGKRTEKSKKKYKFKKTGSLFGQSSRKKVKFKNKNIEKLRRIVRYGEIRGRKLFKSTILPSFKSIKKGIQGAFGMVFKVFGAILSPIGNVVKGTLNAIIHPIQTIKKFASSGIFGFFKTMMKSPSSAYMLGLFLGILYRNVIEPPLNRYIILPLLKLKKTYLQNNENEQNRLIEKIKSKIKIITDFFEPVEGMNFLFGLLYRIAEKLNVSAGLDIVFSTASYLSSPIFRGIINLMKAGLFDYFQGGGIIQKLLMLGAAQQGNLFGEVVGETSNTVGQYYFLNKDAENPNKVIHEIAKNSENDEEQLEEDFFSAAREVNYHRFLLDDMIENFKLTGLTPTMDDILPFFQSELYSSDVLKQVFEKLLGGRKFEQLSGSERIDILTKMKELREKSAIFKYQLYRLKEERIPARKKGQLLQQIGISRKSGIIFDLDQFSGAVEVQLQEKTENLGTSNEPLPDITTTTASFVNFEPGSKNTRTGTFPGGNSGKRSTSGEGNPIGTFNLLDYVTGDRQTFDVQYETAPGNSLRKVVKDPVIIQKILENYNFNNNGILTPRQQNPVIQDNTGKDTVQSGQSSIGNLIILKNKRNFLQNENEEYDKNISLLDRLIASYQMYLSSPIMIGQDNTVIFDGTESV